jgi:transmembrane sensor
MPHFDPFKSSDPGEDAVCAARAWAEAMFRERDLTASERVSFEQWLGNEEHEREFVAALDIRFRFLEVAESARGALLREAAPFTPIRDLPTQRSWTRPWWAVAAAAVLLLGLGVMWMGWPSQTYVTGTGEKLATHLADGSRVELSTQTDLEWLRTNGCDRRVRLVRGEALFTVHGDPRCPFRVLVGRSSIEVLGTEFDVHEGGNGEERVTVVNGRVRVHGPSGAPPWHVDLGPGEQVVWSNGPPQTRKLDDISNAIAWREDRVDFDDQPLAQVVEELQRYTPVQIRIADSRLLSKHLTGEVQVDAVHIRAAVLWLGQRPGIEVKDDGNSLILSYRP